MRTAPSASPGWTRFADWLGEKFHRPSWVALPVLVFTTSIICALFGFIWDVSWHIGKGRDPGPLANPAHYFIIIGLFGVFVAGMVAIVLPFDKPGPAAVRITRNWYAPVGGVLMAGCGLYALIGFPLDDIWHRIFGQDVTLWGPTHLMMIGGAGFSLFAVLHAGARRRGGARARSTAQGAFIKPSCAICHSAACSSACRCTRSSTTSACSSSVWCFSR